MDVDTGGHRDALLPSILIETGLRVECHDDHFDDGTPDSKWLSRCGKEGWIAVTRDKRIRRDDRSIVSIVKSRAKVLTLIGTWPHDELAKNLVNSVYVIEREVQKQLAPFIAKLHMASPEKKRRGKGGEVVMWRDHTALLSAWKRVRLSEE